MTATLVDTDILIEVGRGVPAAVDYLEGLQSSSSLAISVISMMELVVGCQSRQELRAMEKFLARFELVHLNEQISASALELLRKYRLSHGLLIADALIAATALYLGIPFATKNQRDYRFIELLDLVPYPA